MTAIYQYQMQLKQEKIPYVIGHESGMTQIFTSSESGICIAHFNADGSKRD